MDNNQKCINCKLSKELFISFLCKECFIDEYSEMSSSEMSTCEMITSEISSKFTKGNFRNNIDKITDKIYLGNLEGAKNKDVLKNFGVTHILICGNDLIKNYFNDFIYHLLPLED